MAVERVKVVVLASPGPTVAPAILLEAQGLAVGRAGRTVVAGVTFRLEPGEALLVTGPNGAGKSTLLRCLAGLLPPVAGRVTLRGIPPGDPAGEHLHYLGHADGLKRHLSVAENLRVAAAVLGRRGGLAPEAALAAQGLGGLGDLPAGALSAGQRRRVALAMLAVARRPVWLLDEPATALDAGALAGLANQVAGHRAGGGIVVVAAHGMPDLPGAAELSLGSAP